MMADMPTPSQVLADHLLGRPLAEYVAEKRSARPRWSWQLISEQIAADTDGKVAINRESLRSWFSNDSTDGEAVA
jgi:hypothetical protein